MVGFAPPWPPDGELRIRPESTAAEPPARPAKPGGAPVIIGTATDATEGGSLVVTARATTRGTTSRTLAVGGALAVLAAGALTMTDRAMAVAPPAVPVCATPTLQSFTNGTDQTINAAGTPTITSD